MPNVPKGAAISKLIVLHLLWLYSWKNRHLHNCNIEKIELCYSGLYSHCRLSNLSEWLAQDKWEQASPSSPTELLNFLSPSMTQTPFLWENQNNLWMTGWRRNKIRTELLPNKSLTSMPDCHLPKISTTSRKDKLILQFRYFLRYIGNCWEFEREAVSPFGPWQNLEALGHYRKQYIINLDHSTSQYHQKTITSDRNAFHEPSSSHETCGNHPSTPNLRLNPQNNWRVKTSIVRLAVKMGK